MTHPLIAAVSLEFLVEVQELLSLHRSFHRVSRARAVAFYVLAKSGYCRREIGQMFGRDHSTITYGIRATERRMQDAGFAARVERCRK